MNEMMEAWEHAAKNLTTHFHAICHGEVPLHMKWDREAQRAAAMSDGDLDFLARLKDLVGVRGMDYSGKPPVCSSS